MWGDGGEEKEAELIQKEIERKKQWIGRQERTNIEEGKEEYKMKGKCRNK